MAGDELHWGDEIHWLSSSVHQMWVSFSCREPFAEYIQTKKSKSAMDSDSGDSIFVTEDKFSLDKSLSYDTDSAIDAVFFRKPGKFSFNC